jgi:trk system potassium uptake protein TrkH
MLSRLTLALAALMIPPMITAFSYGQTLAGAGFVSAQAALIALSLPFIIRLAKGGEIRAKARSEAASVNAKTGFLSVGFSWLLLGLFAALPLFIGGYYKNYLASFCDVISMLTTTGTVLTSLEKPVDITLTLYYALLQWFGGIGVLSLITVILPKTEKVSIRFLKAEGSAPDFGKETGKLRYNVRIIFIIYGALTALLFLLLLTSRTSAFGSLVIALTTISTSGYTGIVPLITANSYSNALVGVFALLAATNFTLFYLLCIGKIKDAVKNEELRLFVIIIAFSLIAVTAANLVARAYSTFGETVLNSFVATALNQSSTGFDAVDIEKWSSFAVILLFVMSFFGGCVGSTAGGLKLARVLVLAKSLKRDINKALTPNGVYTVRLNGEVLSENAVHSSWSYFALYFIIIGISFVLVSVGGDFENAFQKLTYVTGAMNNTNSPFFAAPLELPLFSKVVLSFDMLLGRLEIFPVLLLFNVNAYRK